MIATWDYIIGHAELTPEKLKEVSDDLRVTLSLSSDNSSSPDRSLSDMLVCYNAAKSYFYFDAFIALELPSYVKNCLDFLSCDTALSKQLQMMVVENNRGNARYAFSELDRSKSCRRFVLYVEVKLFEDKVEEA